MSTKAEGSTADMWAYTDSFLHPSFFSTFLLAYLPLCFLQSGEELQSNGAVRMSWTTLSSSLQANDRKGRGTMAACVCLWRMPHHNGRLTLDDISCCTTRFLSWGIIRQLVCYHAGSLCDPCYNWNKTQIASKTVLPRLKPLSIHTTIIWQWCQ